MNWLEQNPLGMILSGACALLLLLVAGLGFVWSQPASTGRSNVELAQLSMPANVTLLNELDPINTYQEVNDRPLFQPDRRPRVEDEEIETVEETREIADPPRLALRGVIITPDQKMVTVKPVDGGKSLVVGEHQLLGSDFPGWSVTEISPRAAKLESRNGESLSLDLVVNTRVIEEPPKPPAAQESAPGDAEQAELGEEGEEPRSRAEEIRRRIAERREELRRQAGEESGSGGKVANYQQAIQSMMAGRKESDDNENQNDKE